MNAMSMAGVVADLMTRRSRERALRAGTGRQVGVERRLSVDAPSLASSWIPRSERS
jgi:hypothetical protein